MSHLFCCYAVCRYAECLYAGCRNAECHGAICGMALCSVVFDKKSPNSLNSFKFDIKAVICNVNISIYSKNGLRLYKLQL
jgi:hypothetical protein